MVPLKILVWLKILVFFIFSSNQSQYTPKPRQDCNMPRKAIAESAAKFDRIRRAHQSEVAEDYVEMIADLIAETGEARTVDLAARFGVTSPTVNAIIQRLQREDLVETRPYRSIFLTEAGQALAKEARDRHRIVRDFLVAIGVPETIAEEDAEGIEHHVSAETLAVFAKITNQD
jgi:DtxR family manganese transport transcriptional regulator